MVSPQEFQMLPVEARLARLFSCSSLQTQHAASMPSTILASVQKCSLIGWLRLLPDYGRIQKPSTTGRGRAGPDTKYSVVEGGTATPQANRMGTMIWNLLAHGWALSPQRWAVASAITLSFAVVARVLRGVNLSGAWAGGLACFLLFAVVGPGAFAALVALFLMTWLSTRLGYRTKHQLGIAERREGRNGWQISANLGVAALSAVAFGITGNGAWLTALVAALAEAATDTVASEIGQTLSNTAFLITTWETVPAGTDGGITLAGTLSGVAAGVTIAAIATFSGLVPHAQFWIPAASGVFGMLGDSFLGAALQRRGRMSNETVNSCGTLLAAAMAYALATRG